MNDRKSNHQSVLLAFDTESGKLIEAQTLLTMDEGILRELRRASLSGVRRSRISNVEPRLRCGICEGAVHISMRQTEFGNRWFSHHGELTECPYRTDRRMSAEEQLAWLYQGQQEGKEHKRLKHFIADWLEIDPACTAVWRDKVRHSELKRGEWKRPDVRAIIGTREVVFEIQLSYTFLSEVIRRDAFYRQEGVHILWIFRDFEPHREVVRDEMFYNRRNIFVLDEEAEKETIERGKLTLKCYYQTPKLVGETVDEKWHSRFVNLDQLIYPEPVGRPYYRDFDQARAQLLRLRLIRYVMQWGCAMKREDTEVAEKIYANVKIAWRTLKGACLVECEEGLFLQTQLPRLLSIKYGRPIAYRYNSLWQVLNAILQMKSTFSHPFSTLYLMALKYYKPTLDLKHEEQIKAHRKEIFNSIRSGEKYFVSETQYDAAIALVLPELRDPLKELRAYENRNSPQMDMVKIL